MTDLRHALRWLLAHPGFSAIIIVTLALGIGANTAVFSITDALFLKPLPVRNADRLVQIEAAGNEGRTTFSIADLESMQRDVHGLAQMAGHDRGGTIFRDSTSAGAADHWIITDFIAGPYFETLGVSAARGRLIGPVDANVTPAPIVLGDTFWREHFGRDEGVLGRIVTIDGLPCQIVGIAPPEFFGLMVGTSPEVWAPAALAGRIRPASANASATPDRLVRSLHVFGTLTPGTARASALDAARLSLRQIWQQGDPELAARTPLLGSTAWNGWFAQRYRTSLQVLFGLVAVILLVACVNVVSLVMTRAAARQKEVAIRVALGAGRARLVRQLLAEYLLLAGAAMLVALPLGSWLATWLVSLGSQPYLPLILHVDPDRRVLLFAAIVTIGTGLAIGIWPALRAMRVDPNAALHATAADAGSARMRRLSGAWALLPVQIALGVVLLVDASLFVRTVANRRGSADAIDPQHLIFASISIDAAGYDAARQEHQIAELLPQRLASVPGIEKAALTWVRPLVDSMGSRVVVEGKADAVETRAVLDVVSPGYFDTIGIAVLKGRDLAITDRAERPLAAVINQRLARELFGSTDADILGRTLRIGDNGRRAIIVGLVRDSSLESLRASAEPTMYLPLASRRTLGGFELAVRTHTPSAIAIEEIRRALHAIDPRLPLVRAWTFEQEISNALSRERMIASIASVFGLLALLLVAVGVFGALSYAVARRSRELAVRIALGASPASLRSLVLRESLTIAILGLAAGVPMSWLTARALQSLLHGVETLDPMMIAAVAVVVVSVTSLAGYLPARRAARVDPIEALRAE